LNEPPPTEPCVATPDFFRHVPPQLVSDRESPRGVVSRPLFVIGFLVLATLAAGTFDPGRPETRQGLEAAGTYSAGIAEYDMSFGESRRRAARAFAAGRSTWRATIGARSPISMRRWRAHRRRGHAEPPRGVHKALQGGAGGGGFRAGVKRAPTNARLHRELAYCSVCRRAAEALAAIVRAVALDQQNVDFFALRGAITTTRQSRRRVRDVERALQLKRIRRWRPR